MNILIIQTAFIGDVVLSTPLIDKVKDAYPEGNITYVTTPAGASILRNNPNLEEIIEYDKKGEHKGIKALILLGKRLKYKNFDLVVCPHRYIRSTILAWLTGSSKRLGYDNAAGKLLFTERVHYDKDKHEVDRLLSFVKGNEAKRYEIKLFPGSKEVKRVDRIWKREGIDGKKVVTIAPGSKWFTKKWPVEYFNILIEKLGEREDIAMVLIGGKDELLLNLHESKNTINLIGETNLLEVAEITRRSKVVLTNDSSPIHIASAWPETHIIAIFGATVKELGFFPWSKNSQVLENKGLPCRPCGLHGGDKCPKGHFKCMLELKPDMVIEKILSKIDGK